MNCPIRPNHRMTEVAPGLFQCQHCGYGPSQTGYRPFWALSNVEQIGDTVDATSTRWDPVLDCYVMTGVTFRVDDAGGCLPDTFMEGEALFLSTAKELEDAPLPVIIRAKGKWDFPAAKPPLREKMFPTPEGRKEISLSSAQRGTSG